MSDKIQRKDNKDSKEKSKLDLIPDAPIKARLPAKKPLTEKQIRFAQFYTSNGFNATKAARDAGYANPEQNYVKLFNNVKVCAYIQQLMEPMLRAAGISRERLLTELNEHATADIADIVDIDSDGNISFKQNFGGKGKSIKKITHKKDGVISIDMVDKVKAIEVLAKMQGLAEPTEINVKVGPNAEAIEQYELAKQRENAGLIDISVVDVEPVVIKDEEEEEEEE